MATPTPSTLPQPTSASKKAAGHVTTPSHMGLASPAPRSVPSPATTRKDQAGKTPTNHPTVSSQGSKTLYGTPMVPSLSQMGMGSSPGQNVSFGTPGALAGLGVDLGSATPGQLANMTPSLGGAAAMMPTMSELGFGASGSKRNEDEERRAKMRKVLKSIGKTKGRVGEEAIARVARRVGFSDNISVEEGTKDSRDIGNRDLALAGQCSILDLKLKDHVVQSVEVTIMGKDNQPLQEISEPAAQLFLNDLSVPSGVLLESKLDGFAANLDRLARLDKLSISAGVSCFDAINGLYRSLQRLYKIEQEQVRSKQQEQESMAEHSVDVEVLRKRSGKPTMHEHGKFGLALEYWSTKTARDESAMEIDGTDTTDDKFGSIYSLRIEAEGSSAAMYTPLRSSNEWLPKALTLPEPESGQSIPWLDPPATFAQDTAGIGTGSAMAIDGGQHLPDVRFVAKLEPPLVVPYQTATNMLSHLGMAPPQVDFMLHYYALLLDIPAQTIYSGDSGDIEADQTVLTMKDGEEVDVVHRYSLDVAKPDWGFKLEKLPFSHPRQLVELLPHLRQWAHVGELLRNAFGSDPTAAKLNAASTATHDVPPAVVNGTGAIGVPLDDIMATPKPLDGDDTLSVDIGLATSPQPMFSLTYPDPAVAGVRSITAQIQPNADVMVTIGDDDEEAVEHGLSQSERPKNLAGGLSRCNDLSVWLEWARSSP